MSKADIFKALSEMLKDEFSIDLENEGISEKDKINNIGLDSFEIVELMYEIEDQMNIKIENEELAGIETVGQLIDLMENKKVEYG